MSKLFEYSKIAVGKHFVGREEEVKRLSSDFIFLTNTAVMAPQGWGKSSLIQRAAKDACHKEKTLRFHIVGLTGAESEEILYGTVGRIVGKVMRIGHDDRLSVPIKPQVLVFPFAIKAFVEMAQRDERMVTESEGKHKGNLWYIHTILLRLIPCIKQRVCTGVPCKGAVGTAKTGFYTL